MKNNKGITLVALVVTIIVLLILASVSINLVLGDNGIITRAKLASNQTEDGKIIEDISLKLSEIVMEKKSGIRDYILNNMSEADNLFEEMGYSLEIGKDIIISANGKDFVLKEDGTLEKIELDYDYTIVEGVDGEWEYYENANGTLTLTKYLGSSTSVVIPNYYKGKYVTALKSLDRNAIIADTVTNLEISYGIRKIGYNSLPYAKYTSVVIPDSVVCIGEHAFANGKLASVTLSNNLYAVDKYAFEYNFDLGNISFPESLEIIGDSAFNCAQEMTRIELPSNLKILGKNAFRYCDKVTTAKIPGSVKEIGEKAFQICEALTTVEINDGVEVIGERAFYDTKLESLNLPKSVKEIGRAITYKTPTVLNITVDPANEVYVAIDNVVYTKDMKTLILLPTGRTSVTIQPTVKVISTYAGSYAKSTDIQLPEGLEIIEKSAFENSKICSISIPSTVKKIEPYNFTYCSNLTSITVDSENKYYKSVNNMLYSKDGKVLCACASNIAEVVFQPGVKIISEAVFADNTTITSIVIPEGVTTIKDKAFSYCTKVTSITLPQSLKTIGDCSFQDTTLLKTITLPSGLEKIGEWAFSFSGLTEIRIPGSVKVISDSAFRRSDSLNSIILEEGIEKIESVAFAAMRTQPITITIPRTVTYIGSQAFDWSSSTVTINLKWSSVPEEFDEYWDYGVTNVVLDYNE